jgi:hypothetical protein
MATCMVCIQDVFMSNLGFALCVQSYAAIILHLVHTRFISSRSQFLPCCQINRPKAMNMEISHGPTRQDLTALDFSCGREALA